MQLIDRLMIIIKTLSKHNNKGLTITELHRETGLAFSTLHRLLQALHTQKLLDFDKNTKLYYLGDAWLEFGLQVYDEFNYVSKIRPLMDQFARDFNESIYMYKPLNNESLIIERIDGPNNKIRIVDPLGLRVSMPEGAANQIAMAYQSIIENKQFIMPVHIPSLQKIILNNFAIVREKESTTIAIPILTQAGLLKTVVSLHILNFSLTEEREATLINALLQLKTNIEQILF